MHQAAEANTGRSQVRHLWSGRAGLSRGIHLSRPGEPSGVGPCPKSVSLTRTCYERDLAPTTSPRGLRSVRVWFLNGASEGPSARPSASHAIRGLNRRIDRKGTGAQGADICWRVRWGDHRELHSEPLGRRATLALIDRVLHDRGLCRDLDRVPPVRLIRSERRPCAPERRRPAPGAKPAVGGPEN
jgi:hypothetical protein